MNYECIDRERERLPILRFMNLKKWTCRNRENFEEWRVRERHDFVDAILIYHMNRKSLKNSKKGKELDEVEKTI